MVQTLLSFTSAFLPTDEDEAFELDLEGLPGWPLLMDETMFCATVQTPEQVQEIVQALTVDETADEIEFEIMAEHKPQAATAPHKRQRVLDKDSVYRLLKSQKRDRDSGIEAARFVAQVLFRNYGQSDDFERMIERTRKFARRAFQTEQGLELADAANAAHQLILDAQTRPRSQCHVKAYEHKPLTMEHCEKLLTDAIRKNKAEGLRSTETVLQACSWMMRVIRDSQLDHVEAETCESLVWDRVYGTYHDLFRGDKAKTQTEADLWLERNRKAQAAPVRRAKPEARIFRATLDKPMRPQARIQKRAGNKEPIKAPQLRIDVTPKPAPEGGRTPEEIVAYHAAVKAENERKATNRAAAAKAELMAKARKAEAERQAKAKPERKVAAKSKGKSKDSRKAVVAAELAKKTAGETAP